MINNDSVIWLEGYLKALELLCKKNEHFSLSALSIKLSDDIIQSYLEFINNNTDFEELGIVVEPLQLTKVNSLMNYSDVVANNLSRVFAHLENSTLQTIINQVMDVLSIIEPELDEKKYILCLGRTTTGNGNYIFLNISEEHYLVLSFLKY